MAERNFPKKERKTKAQLVPGGPMLDGIEVRVEDSYEKWSEYTLQDGATIRMKQVPLEVVRLIDMYDPEGNPMYVIKAQPVLTIVDIPEKLKKKIVP